MRLFRAALLFLIMVHSEHVARYLYQCLDAHHGSSMPMPLTNTLPCIYSTSFGTHSTSLKQLASLLFASHEPLSHLYLLPSVAVGWLGAVLYPPIPTQAAHQRDRAAPPSTRPLCLLFLSSPPVHSTADCRQRPACAAAVESQGGSSGETGGRASCLVLSALLASLCSAPSKGPRPP